MHGQRTLSSALCLSYGDFFFSSHCFGRRHFQPESQPVPGVRRFFGNIDFITIQNTDPKNVVFITRIVPATLFGQNGFMAKAGEADDRATNLQVVAPNPTDMNPLQIAANGTANIKVSWDAVDTVVDRDVDFGDWTALLEISFYYNPNSVTRDFGAAAATMRVNDAPEPGYGGLIGVLVGGLEVIRRRRNKSDRLGPERRCGVTARPFH